MILIIVPNFNNHLSHVIFVDPLYFPNLTLESFKGMLTASDMPCLSPSGTKVLNKDSRYSSDMMCLSIYSVTKGGNHKTKIGRFLEKVISSNVNSPASGAVCLTIMVMALGSNFQLR